MIDTAREALPELDADTARAARGALCEGFVAARAEIALRERGGALGVPGMRRTARERERRDRGRLSGG